MGSEAGGEWGGGGGAVDGEALLVIEFRKEISVVQEFIFEELFPWLFPS